MEEFEFTPIDNNYSHQVSVTQFLTETARPVNPTRMRSWRVRDTVTTNTEGHAISYHLDPLRAGHIHQGPAVEPFTNNQFYVTVNKPCERFASHNPEVQCAADVSKFVNGASLVGQDVVVWYGITFHHLPRDEDEGMMDAHWDGFQLTPRDWTGTNPLDNVVLGPTATPTATPTDTPVPPTSTSTSTPAAMATATSTAPAVALPSETYTPTPTNTTAVAPTDAPMPQTPTPIGGLSGTPDPPGTGNLASSVFLPYDDGRRLARHARRAGVDVHFDVYPGMVHVFQFMYLIESKSRQAVHAAARFVRKHWGDENAAKSATKAFGEWTG